jgi:sulfite exporter TauE/SafE
MGTIILAGLILGITSNLHCVGMCGPIAMAIPVNRSSNWTILGGVLQYNFGRIITYMLLGLLVGSIGISVNTLGILQWISILAGIFLIVYAWRKFFTFRFAAKLPQLGIQQMISKNIGRILKSDLPLKPLFLGMLNGFLPCGMVYIALMNAILGGHPYTSALAMMAFGIGTLPSMIAVGLVANRITNDMRRKMNKVVPYMLTLVGLLIVLRGMNLDIPFISPKVVEHQIEGVDKPQVEMKCCTPEEECEK